MKKSIIVVVNWSANNLAGSKNPLPLGMGSVKDDFMFCKVMQNNPDLCKHLIELIIGKKITLIQQKL